MKVVHKDDARSDNILDNDAADKELDKSSDSEDRSHIEIDEVQEQDMDVRASLRAVFSWKNYRVYLATAWMFNAFNYLVTVSYTHLRAHET